MDNELKAHVQQAASDIKKHAERTAVELKAHQSKLVWIAVVLIAGVIIGTEIVSGMGGGGGSAG